MAASSPGGKAKRLGPLAYPPSDSLPESTDVTSEAAYSAAVQALRAHVVSAILVSLLHPSAAGGAHCPRSQAGTFCRTRAVAIQPCVRVAGSLQSTTRAQASRGPRPLRLARRSPQFALRAQPVGQGVTGDAGVLPLFEQQIGVTSDAFLVSWARARHYVSRHRLGGACCLRLLSSCGHGRDLLRVPIAH